MRDVRDDSERVEDGHFDELWRWSGEVRRVRYDVSEEREAEQREVSVARTCEGCKNRESFEKSRERREDRICERLGANQEGTVEVKTDRAYEKLQSVG